MRKYCAIFLIFSLTACVKQPNTHYHYAQKRASQTQFSLLDYLFSNKGKSSPYRGPDSYTVHGKTYKTLKSSAGYREKGTATWYGRSFHNQRTSSGEHYDMYGMTAAHRTLPLNTFVKVTNLNNRRSVVVRINDRGPFHSSRLIDLSYAAARGIGLLPAGMAQVDIQTTSPQRIQRPAPKPTLKKTQKRIIHHAAPAKKRLQKINKPTSRKAQKPMTRHAVPVKNHQPHKPVIKKNQKHITHQATKVKKRQLQGQKPALRKNKKQIVRPVTVVNKHRRH